MANEGFLLEFQRRGSKIPVTGLIPGQGIILAGETDAWPLGVALQLEPISAGTRQLWRNIQLNQGWIGDHVFRLNLSVRDERLLLEGIQPNLLPPGRYQLSVCVSGYRFHHRVHEFDIRKSQTCLVKVPEKQDKRSVEALPLDQFDDMTRRVVERSSLDGIPMEDWLRDPARRASRKACALNVLAKLRTPVAANEPLAGGVTRLIFADVDRVYAELEPRFAGRLLTSGSGFEEDAVIHSTHLKLLKKIPGGTAHELHSLREATATNSLQIALAIPGDDAAPQYGDIDIDLGNPFVNPRGFFIHIGELIDPGKTDHLALFKKLQDSPSKDFLYYRLVESSQAAGA